MKLGIRGLAGTLLAGVAAVSCEPRPATDLPAVLDAPRPVAETERFRFFDDARVALFHLLHGMASPEPDPESLAGLAPADVPPGDRGLWDRTLEAFARRAPAGELTDPGWAAIRDYLIGAAPLDRVDSEGRVLIGSLETLLPAYSETRWPADREINRVWLDALLEVLPAVEDRIARDIAVGVRTVWPDRPIDVYMVPHGPSRGGYATGEPVVTIATGTTPARLSEGLEILFHHAAHAFVLEQSLRQTVDAAFEARESAAPPRLWHSILFVTVEEAVSSARHPLGLRPDRALGEAVGYYRRDERYRRDFEVADRYWRPFVRGEVDLPRALRHLVEAY